MQHNLEEIAFLTSGLCCVKFTSVESATNLAQMLCGISLSPNFVSLYICYSLPIC